MAADTVKLLGQKRRNASGSEAIITSSPHRICAAMRAWLSVVMLNMAGNGTGDRFVGRALTLIHQPGEFDRDSFGARDWIVTLGFFGAVSGVGRTVGHGLRS